MSWIKRLAVALPIGGFVMVLLISSTAYNPKVDQSWKYVLHAIATLLMASGASYVLGTFLGFVFAVPKTSLGVAKADPAPVPPNGDAVASQEATFSWNNNIEQVADWIVKLLVGAGIVELQNIPPMIKRLSSWIGGPMSIIGGGDAATNGSSVVASALVFYFVCGFMNGYLATMAYYPRLLLAMERYAQYRRGKITLEDLAGNT